MQRFNMLLLSFGVAITVSAQSVVINADGTHSAVIQTGNTVTAINPDGTHSVGMVTGNMITVVDAQGRHSIGFTQSNTNVNINNDHSFSGWGKDAPGLSFNPGSRNREASPNRFYSFTAYNGGSCYIRHQAFIYSFVSHRTLTAIMLGSKNFLDDLETESIKIY